MDDLLVLVDPQLRAAALQMQQMSQQFRPMSLVKLAMRRELQSSMVAPLLADVPVKQVVIPGPSNAPDVCLWIVNARSGAQRGGILHMHGGGFTAGSARGSVPYLQDAARELDCVIVSVDFRNAPETCYDGSLEDNYAGLTWMH